MSGVMYVIDQLGAALAEANRRIIELEEEIAHLRAERPGADSESSTPTAFTRE